MTGDPQLPLNIGGETRMADFDENQGDGVLRFNYRVVSGDEDTDGIAIDADALTLNGGTITAGGTSATLTHAAEADDPDNKVDGVRPMLLSAETSTDGATVILTYTEQLAAIDLAPGHFTVNVAGSARSVSSALASGTAGTVTLASPVTAGQTVSMGYSGSTGRSNTIQDLPGNTAGAIATSHGVTNNVNTPPEFPESTPELSMPENSAPGLDIGDPVVASDADGDTLTYSLLQGAGTDGSSFDIVPSSGQLRTRSGVTYSYEGQRSFIVQVRVDDANGGTDGIFVQIELTDVEEPPLAPDPPTVSPVSGSSDGLSVSWTAPDNTGKPDIDSYDLQYRKGTSGTFTDGPQAVADTMATIDGLDANASYQVQVRATNDEGDGPWSSAGTGSTSADTTPPTLTSAYSGPGDLGEAVHLTFSEDLDLDNLPSASLFRLTADGSPVAINFVQIGNSDNEFVLLSLAPVIRQGQTVVVTYIDPTLGDDAAVLQDAAGNDVANFTATLENNSPVAPAAPGAPTGLGATAAGATRIDLAWTAPADNGGRAITGYRIEQNVRATAGTGKVTLTWQAPASEGASAITHYEYQRKEGTGAEPFGTWTTAETVAFGSNSSSAILRDATTLDHYDVKAQTTYTYQVRAVNAAGNGPVSEFSTAITGAALTVKVLVAEPNVAENEGPVAVEAVAELPATGPNAERYDLEFQVDFFNKNITAVFSGFARDFVSLALQPVFAPGDFEMESGRWVASKPFTVTLVDDAVVEPDETFLVVVAEAEVTTRPSHPFITFPGATDDVTVTIVNDDVPEWAVSVAPATIAEAAGTATVTVSTGGVTFEAAQTIDLDFDGGTATAGTDFTVADADGNPLTSPYALTLPIGDSTVTATITAVDDLVDDDDEQIQVTATQNGAKLGEAQTLTITDDDTASTALTLSVNPEAVSEGATATTVTVTAALDGAARTTATDVTVSRTGGTATSGTDYAAVSDFTITIPAASMSAMGTFSFEPTDDTVAEGAETVILTGSATGLGSATAELTITDDDTNSQPAFSKDSVIRVVNENAAAGVIVGPVVTAIDADGDTLTYSLEGTDADSFEIDSSSGQIRAKAGVTYDFESKSEYSVTVKADDGKGGTDTIAVRILLDDVDEPPSAPTAVTVSAVPGTTDRLMVSWTAPENDGKPAIESYRVRYWKAGSGDQASEGPQDVTGTTATITGLEADTSYEVQVGATNDEGPGTWSAAGTGSTNAAADPIDSDSVTATVGTGKIRLEWTGSADAYEYRRQEAGGAWSAWTEARTGGWFVLRTATTLDDYDVLAETTYTYQVREAGASDMLGEAEATLGPPITLRLDRTAYSVDEGAGELLFTVLAEVPAPWDRYDRDIHPSFTSAGVVGPLPEGPLVKTQKDYELLSESLHLEPADFERRDGRYVASRQRSIGIVDDTLVEGDETFELRVLLPSGVSRFFEFGEGDGRAEVTIVDNEAGEPSAPAKGNPLTGFELVDATAHRDAGAIEDGATLTGIDPGKVYGVRANVASGAEGLKSVTLTLSGPGPTDEVSQTEGIEPYSLYGDSGGHEHGAALPAGSYTLTATAYSEARGGGGELGTLSVGFTVAASPLTARFEGLPEAGHGGAGTPFTFRVVLSESIETGEADFRDHGLAVTGGTVTAASRVAGEPGGVVGDDRAGLGWDGVCGAGEPRVHGGGRAVHGGRPGARDRAGPERSGCAASRALGAGERRAGGPDRGRAAHDARVRGHGDAGGCVGRQLRHGGHDRGGRDGGERGVSCSTNRARTTT